MEKSPEARLIVSCLSGGEAPDGRVGGLERVDPERLLRLADRNLVRHAVCERLSRLSLPASFPAGSLEKIAFQRELCLEILMNQARACARILASRGIPSAVLKGLTIPSGVARDIYDLDLLIPEDRLLDAIEAMAQAGYPYVGDDLNARVPAEERGDFIRQSRWNSEYIFRHPQSGLLIELHTNLFQKGHTYPQNLDAYLAGIGEIWSRRARCERLGLDGLSPEDLFLLMSVHGSIKRCPGLNRFVLRTVLDLRSLAESGLDWGLVLDLARRYEIGEHVLLALRLVEIYFPGAIPASVSAGLAKGVPAGKAWIAGLHFSAFGGIEGSRPLRAFLYRLLVPFFYGGSLASRFSHARKAFLSPFRHVNRWLTQSRSPGGTS